MCFRRHVSRLLSGAGHFAEDCRGNVLVIFGIAVPATIIAIGMAIDFAQQSHLTSQMQKAVDAAALAGVTELVVEGATSASAQSTAQAFFSANSPTGGVTGSATISPSAPGSTATMTVTYSGSLPTVFGGLLNINALPINVTATAQGKTSSNNSIYYAGNGSVAGDPHIGGADGTNGYLQCATPSGSWYNLLSDAGIEVNVSCVTYPEIWADVVQSFSILLGSHVISLYAPSATFTQGVASYDASTAWFGQVTIDGVTYPATIGQQNYLGGQLKVTVTDLTNFYKSDNWLEITTPTYKIFITYDAYAMGDINITATNAGKCGVPGGFWGGTLAGKDDYNGSDFLVSGPTATTAQFNWSTCQIYAHLIQ